MRPLRVITILLLFSGCICTLSRDARAERGARASRRGPWIVYRYPVFRQGNRPPEVRGRSQDYFWPLDVNERYPKFYGGLHARQLQHVGTPPGDRGFRGYAW